MGLRLGLSTPRGGVRFEVRLGVGVRGGVRVKPVAAWGLVIGIDCL